jgi:hypothetical protein
MTDSWQIVRQRPESKRTQPRLYVSLNRRGEIAMNAKAFAAIGQPATVTLLYDPKTNSIGVKYPVAIDNHFFRVRRTGRGRKTLIVNAERMLKQFAIKVGATRVFRNVQCVRFEGQPMLLMSLDEAVTLPR